MFGKKKKGKKKKQPVEQFESLSANGAEVAAINFTLRKAEDGTPLLEVRTPDVTEALHYDEVEFELKTSLKMIRVKGKFLEAISEKRFKLYRFEILDYSQFFI